MERQNEELEGVWHQPRMRRSRCSGGRTLGYDVDRPWRELPKMDRDWLLFTEEQPTVPAYAGFTLVEVRRARKRKAEPSYMGTFTGARRYVLQTLATTESALMKKRVSQYLTVAECKVCNGKRLKPAPLSVTFAGYGIAAPFSDGSTHSLGVSVRRVSGPCAPRQE